jgi:hypothetical protein
MLYAETRCCNRTVSHPPLTHTNLESRWKLRFRRWHRWLLARPTTSMDFINQCHVILSPLTINWWWTEIVIHFPTLKLPTSFLLLHAFRGRRGAEGLTVRTVTEEESFVLPQRKLRSTRRPRLIPNQRSLFISKKWRLPTAVLGNLYCPQSNISWGGFWVDMAVSMKMAAFSAVAPCTLVDGCQRLRSPCCLHYQSDNGELLRKSHLSHRSSVSLHGFGLNSEEFSFTSHSSLKYIKYRKNYHILSALITEPTSWSQETPVLYETGKFIIARH